MQSPDIWSEIPYGQYTYPLDSLLNGSDSVQQAESLRMIRDLYLANVESSQGANQFIKFSQHISDNWLPSLLSSDSLALSGLSFHGALHSSFISLASIGAARSARC